MTQSNDNASLRELFADLGREVATLVRQEMRLARTEVTANLSKMGRGAAMAAAGGAVAYGGFLVLLFAAVFALVAFGIAAWLAALIVAVVVVAIGAFLVRQGITAIRQAHIAPTETAETLKQDVAAAKEEIK